MKWVVPALSILGLFSCQLAVDGNLDSVACSDEGAAGPPACQEGFRCEAGRCVVIETSLGLGQRCASDASCTEGDRCVAEKALTGTADAVCARSCCTSHDCGTADDGFVCWVPEDGGTSLCRRGSDVGRGRLGEAKPGAACKEDAECRSGVCGDGRCADVCCSDTNCAAQGASCVAAPEPIVAWQCGVTPIDAGNYLAMCETDEDCRSHMCVEVGSEKRCSMPCCGSAECGSLELGELPAFVACEEVEHDGSWLRACSRLIPPGAIGVVGVPCDDDLECRSGQCAKDPDGSGQCTDVCCGDDGCGDATAFSCALASTQPTWALRCETK